MTKISDIIIVGVFMLSVVLAFLILSGVVIAALLLFLFNGDILTVDKTLRVAFFEIVAVAVVTGILIDMKGIKI